ncbi:MAG TPA: hypothetical protein DDZ89_17335, partial [Clostridiales bacterium]|nr:hypothetical protein [Clostridiales bacterium]
LKVFRHKKDDTTVAFFVNEQIVRKDGLIDGTNNVSDPDAFKTVFSEDDNTITGNPVMPTGYVSNKVIILHKEEWEIGLDVGDNVLNIHIPGGRGRMPYEDCAYSLKTAISFYKEHYPNEHPKAFYCSSWLLGNGLELLLKEDSNIIRFQREFYLAPVKSDEKGTNFFMFGKYDISDVTPKTTLEKKLFEYMDKGIYMYNGCGFILFKDIQRYGEQYYRNRFITL